MKLFNPKNIKRIFDIISSLGRMQEKRYDGKCEKEIFVTRVLNKYFTNKYFRIIRTDCLGSIRWEYIKVVNVSYQLGYSEKITVNYMPAHSLFLDKKNWGTGLSNILPEMVLSHNDVLSLEGEEITGKDYIDVANKFVVVLPRRTFTFRSYTVDQKETTWSCESITESGAYALKNKANETYDGFIGDLISVL